MDYLHEKAGQKGEELGLKYLKKQGYKIIERNYRTRLGEIDIIAKDKDIICFIEVRSINTKRFGLPEDSVDRKKQSQIAKAALTYIKRDKLEKNDCRFDMVSIEDVNSACPKIRMIKDAFELPERYRY